ncbi:hypothetical protein M6B22_11085 [Jatrophihabitans cynanchi]|uniref:Uncharacterized protein n=1 Tax=Jatrophihabitans cynanchi TaxID=2944128 RepID=A0ABY7JRC4_9ACTN|nr:hypothetical protein [Jatrophihabitans sp. SB3-54]WAX55104.1 hypothetical protein M6B22_11085 [Jatrophihabitans sp. SB3-54]
MSRRAFVVGVLALGGAMLLCSWLVSSSAPWLSATLDNVGVVILLLIPGEFALTRLRSGFARIERGVDEARATSQAAMDTAERTQQSLEQIRQTLLARQQAEHEDELDLYRRLVTAPTRESLFIALRHATDVDVLTPAGVRVPVWETDLHYRFVLGTRDYDVTVQLEQDDGTIISMHPWSAGTPTAEFFQQLVQAVRNAGGDLGVGLNDPTESVEQLAGMLVDVTRLRAQELMGYRGTLRRIIERRDGWYFTETHVLPPEDLGYQIAISRLDEMDWENHLRNKGWYDAGAALAFARRLYGA